MTLDHALLMLRAALEDVGGTAVGTRLVVSNRTMDAVISHFGGIMSSTDGEVFHALGFEFTVKA